ncbi:MAG: hypothetical protein ACK5Z4_12245 [Planctomyces sp.]
MRTALTGRSVLASFGLSLVVLAAAGAGGCSENDASAVTLMIKPDFSGTIRASRVIVAEQGQAAEAFAGITGGGVTFTAGASVAVTTGTFSDLAALRIGEGACEAPGRGPMGGAGAAAGGAGAAAGGVAGAGGAGTMIKVRIPRGPSVRWPAMLSEPSDERRAAASAALDPAGAADSKVGRNATFVITVPGKVLGSAASQRARGLAATSDDATATLVVPMSFATAEGEPLIWHVTWE